jgi:hypothetical protein
MKIKKGKIKKAAGQTPTAQAMEQICLWLFSANYEFDYSIIELNS